MAQGDIGRVGGGLAQATEARLPAIGAPRRRYPLLHRLAPEVRVASAARGGAHVDERLDTGAAQDVEERVLVQRPVPERDEGDHNPIL